MRLWAYGSAVWSMGGRRRENCDSIMLPAIRVRGGGRIKNSRGSSRGDSDRERPFCRGVVEWGTRRGTKISRMEKWWQMLAAPENSQERGVDGCDGDSVEQECDWAIAAAR